ncbi:unnamed protein product [Zymoseptoria tritici ST99CH_3D1]|nr:unnamed protein product [Zymoseptoria tritici ST99CH_3D1]
MVQLKLSIFALASSLASTFAVDIIVSSAPGNKTGSQGHPYGYGFLHEDINNSGDGGIYAELIRNRAFQSSERYPVSLDGYSALNGAQLSIQNLTDPLSDALPSSMRVSVSNSTSPPSYGPPKGRPGRPGRHDHHGRGMIGFQNDGYWGMDVKCQPYTGSFWVRGEYHGKFVASLQSNLTDEVFGSVEVPSKSVNGEWVEHEFVLVPEKDAPSTNNTFAVTFDQRGTPDGFLDFNLISLFPPTYKGRKNGLRIDLAEALEEINPTYFRFPGGNMLEGNTNETYWDWKDSLGPLRNRPGFEGVWGYQQTHGLGLMEYLYWAEDMKMNSILGVWAGLALNGDITPEADLQYYIDDALDQIEFIRGPASSPWGARRAALGHPEPFVLQYVEIGNEDWLAGFPSGWDSYRAYRFPLFYAAITAAYPDIQVIASSATSDPEEGEPLTYPSSAIGDYHPYREPDELVEEFSRFDNDIGHIVGEVAAVHPNGGTAWDGGLQPLPWWQGTVGEAVSMIGYERNSDRIPGTFYAPVMRNTNRWQWAVTMLQNDAGSVTRSTSWYVWSLFAHHPISQTSAVEGEFGPVWYGAGVDEARGGAKVWKGAVYNTTDGVDVEVKVKFEGLKGGTNAALTVLTNLGEGGYAANDPATGVNVVGVNTTVLTADGEGTYVFDLPELSVAVLDTDVEAKTIGRYPGDGK